jgi:hypothetical protein
LVVSGWWWRGALPCRFARAHPPRPHDTTPEAEHVQLSQIRAASIRRRLHLAFGLSATAINLARRAIARTRLPRTRIAGSSSWNCTYYIPADRLRWAVTTRASCNLIHLPTMFKIDLFVPEERPFDLEAAGRVQLDAIDDTPDAPIVPIASDTVLSKLESFRRGGETSDRQWWDIDGVLKIRRDADHVYLRRWAESLGVADLLERALADADAA